MPIRSHSINFNSARDIPSLEGKTILVTGGNIGLGKQCILEYARHNPANLWLAARNLEKAQAAVDEIQQQLPNPAPIKLLELDLASVESIKTAVNTFSKESDRLDILMLNAGIMASPPGLTKDGYELQFGTNYVGHVLLAKLLLPLLEKTASMPSTDVRIVMLSSDGHRFAPKEGIIFDSLKTKCEALGPIGRYGQSKLAEILWVKQMAKSYPQFTVVSIHPGVVRTNLLSGATGFNWGVRLLGKVATAFLKSVDEGVKNQLWASVSKDVKSGLYYEPIGIVGKGTAQANNDSLAQEVWDWTEKELEKYST
ncbi:NAD(P)-binding protein [Lojkania enalia]|uniref:NAD(P)-binding protein n=1 Tax=Lojkania enalia TaxID=147567 RepID=A0A9P4N7G7_9PLEO|nr:NAD(P)-binding protein [Didymosphaeria enalia]